MSSIHDFMNKLKSGVRPNRFEVIITFPSYAGGSGESLTSSALVTAASLPGDNLGVIEQSFRGGRKLKIPGDRTFDEWNCTIVNDGEMSIYNAMKKWQNAMSSYDSNIMPEIADMYSQVEINQLNTNDETIHTQTIKLAWPSVVAPIELSYDSNDTLSTFEVTWQYSSIENGVNT